MSNKRVDLKRILADPDLRRRLMVSTIQATQAREGIRTSFEQASRAYYVVTEGEKASFFDLDRFKPGNGHGDLRHEMFVSSLGPARNQVRFDISRRDFSAIEGSPLAYNSVGLVAPLFRSNPNIEPGWGIAQRGAPTGEDERLVRFHWEVSTLVKRPNLSWEPFSKGGDFCRFYYDVALRVAWSHERKSFYDWYGRTGRPIERPESLDLYFQSGLVWPRRTQRGFNLRSLPIGCIFSDKSGFIQPSDRRDDAFLLGVLNSDLIEFVLRSLMSFGSYEVGVVKKLPVPKPQSAQRSAITEFAKTIEAAKAEWDIGNEISTRFSIPWLLRADVAGSLPDLRQNLTALANHELRQDQFVEQQFKELNNEVFRLYGVSDETRSAIREALQQRPPEIVWPQMEGKTVEQKRMEHVWRLLSYAVKRIVEDDVDGVVPFMAVVGKLSLLDRIHEELGKLFLKRDANEVEVEIVNELKAKVKGYDRVESIREWLENVYFDYHASLYKSRPIFWHVSSKQGKGPAAFSAQVHYHRFDKDRMAKLRGVYLREALGVFRREAALANQEGRPDDRLEWQAKVEEAEEFERRLKQVQEGFHQGAEDFRILTPWKTEAERPKGWDPDINDGVKVNIEPLQRAGVLRIPEVV